MKWFWIFYLAISLLLIVFVLYNWNNTNRFDKNTCLKQIANDYCLSTGYQNSSVDYPYFNCIKDRQINKDQFNFKKEEIEKCKKK